MEAVATALQVRKPCWEHGLWPRSAATYGLWFPAAPTGSQCGSRGLIIHLTEVQGPRTPNVAGFDITM